MADDDQVFKATWKKPLPSAQCTASYRSGERRGERCTNNAQIGLPTCWPHSPKNQEVQKYTEAVRLSAIMEMVGSVDLAVNTLVHLSKNANSEAIALKASTELLDRSGIRAGVDVFVEERVTDDRASDLVNDRLNKLFSASSRGGVYGAAEEDTADSSEEDGGQLLLPLPPEEEAVEGELIFPPGFEKSRGRTRGRIAAILPPQDPEQ